MNLPNKITVGRIFMMFIFLMLANIEKDGFIMGRFGFITDEIALTCHIIAYIVAILAGVTDVLDGYIARKYNLVTDFGALMDPLADKIFITTTFIMMVAKNLMPGWIAVVVITREFLVTGLRMLATQKGEVIAADRWGKLKTFLQMMMLLIGGASWIKLIDLHGKVWGISVWPVWCVVLWGIVIVTVWSGLGYFLRNRHLYAKN